MRIRHLILSLLFLLSVCVSGQTSTENYVRIRSYTQPDSSQWRDKIVYYDDMGREEQTVQVGASTNGGDIVTLKEYDIYGRLSKEWSPAAVVANGGAHVQVTALKACAVQSNSADVEPYSLTVYEPSPLNRLKKQFGAGSDWHQHDRQVSSSYCFNIEGDTLLNCLKYTPWQGTGHVVVYCYGNVPTGTYSVQCTTDEDGNRLYEFRDLDDQLVLSRQVVDGANLDTYYVRDEWGQVQLVLPPLASSALTEIDTPWSSSYTSELRNYAYIYYYDYRHRQIGKKLPGCDWEYTVYDGSDLPVFRQDGRLRQKGQWQYTLYDAMGRPCQTGTCTNSMDAFSNPLTTNVIAIRNMRHYTYTGITLSSNTTLQTTFYDTYDGLPASCAYQQATGYGSQENGVTKGRVTYVEPRTLTTTMQNVQRLTRAYYYDYRGNVIQTHATTLSGTGNDSEYVLYDFTNHPVARKASLYDYYNQYYTYQYDQWGRLTQKRHRYGSGEWVTLADKSYDGIGRLAENRRNGAYSNKTTHSYNVRSWPISITSNHFSQSLYYNNPPGWLSAQVRYGGNLSAMEMELGSGSYQHAYYYDGLNRLSSMRYNDDFDHEDYFSTSYTYDPHGNVAHISRYAQSVYGYDLVDDLTMTYSGNQLTAITQDADPDDFYDYTPYGNPQSTAGTCTYDTNGNMTQNLRKGIQAVYYNILNKPSRIQFSDGSLISYVYDMTGAKKQVTYSTVSGGSTVTTRLDYYDRFVLSNYSLSHMPLEDDGIYTVDGYCFYIRDYLGSVRALTKQSGQCVQRNLYYPFGGLYEWMIYENPQPYRYIGKELDRMYGLDWYDYGARMYDPGLGRFMTMDPLAEKYFSVSPYVYCLNNPVKYIDTDGRAVETVWDLANIGLDVASLVSNVKDGNYVSAAVDAGATMVDLAAATIPFVPGGAGAALKAYRAGKSAHTAGTTIKATRNNYRRALQKATGKTGIGYEAHHTLPQKFRKQFEELGINIDEPGNVVWRETKSHRKINNKLTKEWNNYMRKNHTKKQIMEKKNELEKKYFGNTGDKPNF